MEIDVLVSETMCLNEAKARCAVSREGPNHRSCDPPRPTDQIYDLLRNLATGSYPRSVRVPRTMRPTSKWTQASNGPEGRRHSQDLVVARMSLCRVVQDAVTHPACGPAPSAEPGVTGEAAPSRRQ